LTSYINLQCNTFERVKTTKWSCYKCCTFTIVKVIKCYLAWTCR